MYPPCWLSRSVSSLPSQSTRHNNLGSNRRSTSTCSCFDREVTSMAPFDIYRRSWRFARVSPETIFPSFVNAPNRCSKVSTPSTTIPFCFVFFGFLPVSLGVTIRSLRRELLLPCWSPRSPSARPELRSRLLDRSCSCSLERLGSLVPRDWLRPFWLRVRLLGDIVWVRVRVRVRVRVIYIPVTFLGSVVLTRLGVSHIVDTDVIIWPKLTMCVTSTFRTAVACSPIVGKSCGSEKSLRAG